MPQHHGVGAAPAAPPHEACRTCAHFCNDPAYLERILTGMASFGSAYASVRAEDGICARHDRYLGAGSWCSDFRSEQQPRTK